MRAGFGIVALLDLSTSRMDAQNKRENVAGRRPDYSQTLTLLANKGVRYSTVIDLGCADGHFFVQHYLQGIFKDSVPVHIDANALYEPSLKSIQTELGGHYRIAAASDQNGTIELTTSVHPYWSSVRGTDDLYWARINKLSDGAQTVPAIRLDDLAAEMSLKPPYLLKLDIQGAEVDALKGARHILNDTHVVICEADLADFQAINAELTGAGFDLFDVTGLSYTADHWLGWFYPVYLNRKLAHLIDPSFWREESSGSVIDVQIKRRKYIVDWLAESLAKIKSERSGRT